MSRTGSSGVPALVFRRSDLHFPYFLTFAITARGGAWPPSAVKGARTTAGRRCATTSRPERGPPRRRRTASAARPTSNAGSWTESSWGPVRDSTELQKEVCLRYQAMFVAAPPGLKVGISPNVRTGLLPLNGLRHRAEGGTTGWYLWAGETMHLDADFFVPLHVEHLTVWCPAVLPFLGLPPGWRFRIADDYEDVWEDPSLLATDDSSSTKF